MSAVARKNDPMSQSLHFFTVILIAILLTYLVAERPAWSAGLSVTRDGESIRLASDRPALPPSQEKTRPAARESEQTKDNSAQLQKEAELKRVAAPLEEEEFLTQAVVQTLDRKSAARWLGGFISSKPWNCPLHERNDWIEAILYAVERNQLPICKEILGLVASLISIESGFHADPLVADPARRGSMANLLKRAELKLFEKYGPLMSIPPVPKYYAAYKNAYWPQVLACRTETDVEAVARRVADDLKKDADNFPPLVKEVVHQKINKVANVVRSKGSMQLKLFRACPAMKNRGEEFTEKELTEYMYTMKGGVDVGVAALKPVFVQYAARYAKKDDLSWLFFVGMDYHYGPFSSRNMMEQVRIRDLSGRKIAIDGSFLNHDEEGVPAKEDSETLLAAMEAFPSISREELFGAFLLEREPHYIYTNVHRAIAEAHKQKFGETPFAVIGEIRMGETAEIKFGTTWTTNLYLSKLDRYLNSIPWDN